VGDSAVVDGKGVETDQPKKIMNLSEGSKLKKKLGGAHHKIIKRASYPEASELEGPNLHNTVSQPRERGESSNGGSLVSAGKRGQTTPHKRVKIR